MPAGSRRHDRPAVNPRRAPATQESLQQQPATAGLLWTREAQPRPLTREDVVAAAIDLADAEGLDAVTIRAVAARLKTRPMGLYKFIARKDDLIELMLDEVIGESLLDQVSDDWRQALRAIARSARASSLRHPWVMTAVGQRARLGPNAVRHAEQSLAAVAGIDIDAARKRALLIAVDAYTTGHAAIELATRETQRREGLTDQQWEASTRTYFRQLLDSGDYPHLASFGLATALARDDHDRDFETGLDALLTGFATAFADHGTGR